MKIARLFLFLLFVASARAGHQLDVEVIPRFNGAPLALDTLALETPAKQKIAVTRCDFLLTSAALQKETGEWIGSESWAAFVSIRNDRTHFVLPGVPEGKFVRIRFYVGVPAKINSSDPAQFPAGHPLNPIVNGLHWGWQGGYVFAAIEGLWKDAEGAMSGYSYHIARSENLMTVDLPLALNLDRDQTVHLGFELQRFFDGLSIREDNATTHSRPGDPLVVQLRANLEHAFSVDGVTPTPTRAEAAQKANALIGPKAVPYRFVFSSTFPRPSLPLDNPLTNEGVELGAKLFHDTQFSQDKMQSCASCHMQEHAFTDARKTSVGFMNQTGTRSAMPLINLAWKSSFFWDGRAPTLRKQVEDPIQNPVEMHSTLPLIVQRVEATPEYPPLFEKAFGTPEVNFDRIARALEQYLLTRVSFNSKFDRAMKGGEALTPEEQRGFQLFNTEYDPARGQYGADCFHCHGGALFQSVTFANNGLDLNPADPGRYKITHHDGDMGKFAVPSLRNVALTAPYMHDGRFATLEEVIDHYDHGVVRSGTLDPNLAKHPKAGLGLSAADKQALVAFLKTLTDDSLAQAAKTY